MVSNIGGTDHRRDSKMDNDANDWCLMKEYYYSAGACPLFSPSRNIESENEGRPAPDSERVRILYREHPSVLPSY